MNAPVPLGTVCLVSPGFNRGILTRHAKLLAVRYVQCSLPTFTPKLQSLKSLPRFGEGFFKIALHCYAAIAISNGKSRA